MNKVFSFNGFIDLVKEFFEVRYHRSAAALSYFLVMTLFPMLICAQWILSSLGTDIITFLEGFSDIIPESALTIFEDYLNYTGNASDGLLIIGIIMAIYTGGSAFRMLTELLQKIFESRSGGNFLNFILGFVYAAAFLLVIYLFAIILLAGRWLINLLEPFFLQIEFINLLNLANLWNWLRFIILDLVSAVLLYALYYSCSWRSPYRMKVLPGAALGSIALTIVSGVFSFVISSSVNYSVVYGSLASVIILLLWLYILGNIIIIGALLNKKLSEHRDIPHMKLHRSVHKYIKKKPE